MKIEEAIRLMKFMRNGYQKLIDENCAEGKVVGTDVTGTWKSSTPLTDVYQKHIDACDTAIEALEKQMPKKIRVYHDESDTEEMFEDMCACPVCDRDLHGGGDKYCPRCGQKILWVR